MARWWSRSSEHERVAELLSTYLDGRASEAERALVERHLASCADCTRDLETLRATVAAVREMPRLRATHSFALPRSMAKQPRTSPWLIPALQGATALVAILFVITVAGDALRSSTYTMSAPMPAPASVAREAAATSAPSVALKAAPQAAQPSFDQSVAAATPTEAGPTAAATAIEPPTEQSLHSDQGGVGAAGGAATGLGGGQPPSIAPSAPARAAAPLAASNVTPTVAMKSAGVAPTATEEQVSTTPVAPTVAPPAPTASPQPVAGARAVEPQPPIPVQPGAESQAAPHIVPPLRIAEVALAALTIVLGAVTWIARRRNR